MADLLFVSYWLRGYSPLTMLRSYEKILKNFPFSPVNPENSVLRIRAINYAEPELLERGFPDPVDIEDIIETANEFSGTDLCYELETWWGLWQYDRDWKLRPARVTISCFGPDFESLDGEHLRLDFGVDINFLPNPDLEGSGRLIQSNVQGLLRLVHTLDDILPVDRRSLQTDSGENFAEKLQDVSQTN